MKYFKGHAAPSFVGADLWVKLVADSEKEASELFHDRAIDHIESFENPQEKEEESGVEYEYDYHVQEITKEEFDNLDVEDLSL